MLAYAYSEVVIDGKVYKYMVKGENNTTTWYIFHPKTEYSYTGFSLKNAYEKMIKFNKEL